jgi:hypothetical protein
MQPSLKLAKLSPAIYYALHQAYERWPGAPQRPAEEQEYLVQLKAMFFAMQLESRLDWK